MKPSDAHFPATYDEPVVRALQAMNAGKASDGQQKLALDWIITKACNLYDMSYRADADGGARAEAFHEGRRFVGNQIVKMLRPETVAAIEASKKRAAQRKTRRPARNEANTDG